MTSTSQDNNANNGRKRLPQQATDALRFTAMLPFKIASRIVQHTAQIIFAIFVLFLHPQAKWLMRVVANSVVVRVYLRPALSVLGRYLYEPYFAYLGHLPPYWATFSIALPLAILEPAKVTATVLAVTRPKIGVVLWLLLQVIGLVLIDRTWVAVRPQARRVRLVALAHAWLWLNAEYGKYWISHSQIYLTAAQWAKRTRIFFREFRERLLKKRASAKG
jgi:hypothetical protein